jgi:hypothetical protein
MKIIIVFLILFCFCSCQIEKGSNESASPQKLLIKFEKMKNQYGYAAYSVEIYTNGSVILQSLESNINVKKAVVEKSRLDELVAAFENANFQNLSDRYVEGDNCKTIITHEQTVSIFFHSGGANKTVAHYLGCQGTDETKRLEMLEKQLEDFVRTENLLP